MKAIAPQSSPRYTVIPADDIAQTDESPPGPLERDFGVEFLQVAVRVRKRSLTKLLVNLDLTRPEDPDDPDDPDDDGA